MPMSNALRLPVIFSGAEHLVRGYLMRRNILAYQAPTNHEGYDLICIHPDPRHKPRRKEQAQVRVQVKSRYATDCGLRFPLHANSFDTFDFVIAVFLNIGEFAGSKTGLTGGKPPDFYTLPPEIIRRAHVPGPKWSKVELRRVADELEDYKNEKGFEFIAKKLGIPRPQRDCTL
jgi:hypothetical protein